MQIVLPLPTSPSPPLLSLSRPNFLTTRIFTYTQRNSTLLAWECLLLGLIIVLLELWVFFSDSLPLLPSWKGEDGVQKQGTGKGMKMSMNSNNFSNV